MGWCAAQPKVIMEKYYWGEGWVEWRTKLKYILSQRTQQVFAGEKHSPITVI